MAFKHLTVTIAGAAAQSVAPDTHIPVNWVRMESVTGNADVKVGDKTISTNDYGFILEDGPAVSKEIGPFGGGTSPLNLNDIWIMGTDTQVIHLTYTTQ